MNSPVHSARFGHAQLGGRDALDRKGPQRWPQRRLDRRLEEVAEAVRGGYCRLQMPLKLALGVRGTVAGHGPGALEGRGGDGAPTLPMHPCSGGHLSCACLSCPPCTVRDSQAGCPPLRGCVEPTLYAPDTTGRHLTPPSAHGGFASQKANIHTYIHRKIPPPPLS